MSRQQTRYDGQIAVVTGAGSGIGNQLARDLVERGAQVVGVDVRTGPLSGAAGITAIHCDLAAVAGTICVLPGMARRGFGSVLNCSSDSVRSPIARESAYVASKGALSAFTESVALEVQPSGVHVHILYPGFVETPLAIRSLERGMKRPPKAVRRTTAQVSAAALDGIGGRAIEINAARAAAMTPLLRILAPPMYRRVMAGRSMPM